MSLNAFNLDCYRKVYNPTLVRWHGLELQFVSRKFCLIFSSQWMLELIGCMLYRKTITRSLLNYLYIKLFHKASSERQAIRLIEYKAETITFRRTSLTILKLTLLLKQKKPWKEGKTNSCSFDICKIYLNKDLWPNYTMNFYKPVGKIRQSIEKWAREDLKRYFALREFPNCYHHRKRRNEK